MAGVDFRSLLDDRRNQQTIDLNNAYNYPEIEKVLMSVLQMNIEIGNLTVVNSV